MIKYTESWHDEKEVEEGEGLKGSPKAHEFDARYMLLSIDVYVLIRWSGKYDKSDVPHVCPYKDIHVLVARTVC